MKKVLIATLSLFLLFISCPVFANAAFDSAMKSANAALGKKDYVAAEKYYGIAAREFNKMNKSPVETIKSTSPAVASINAEELKAHMPNIKQFSDDIQEVYYLSKDNVAKEFLLMLIMAEDGAKLLVDQPGMLELTNQILKNDGTKNINSDKSSKEQNDFLKGMYNTNLKDMNKGF